MAACAGYSTCSIRFVSNNKKQNQHEYSDRSTIEIRQHDCGNYSLRAIDVTNNKTEIFDIQLTSKRQYQVGSTDDDPDKVETELGTYYLSLARPMRKNFHKDLRKCFNEIAFISESNESPLEIDSDDDEYPMFDESYKNSDDDYDDDVNTIPAPDFLLSSSPPFRSRHSDIADSMPLSRPPPLRSELNSASSEPNLTFLKTNPSNDFRKANPVSTPPKLEPAIVPPTDLLHDTHSLGKFISNGNENEAARIATLLCQHSVQLQVKSLKTKKNDKKFTIQIQIDGNEYGLDQSGPKVSVNVYQSTTVRELRAAFEFAYQQLPPSQYFFVNGALAHDDSSMQDLNVGSGTVFVLFLLTHLKKI